MMDEKKTLAITLLLEGKLTKVEIAKKCKMSRQWLYDAVLSNPECKAEVDRRLQEIQTDGINLIKCSVTRNIENIMQLANNSDSEKIRLDANTYLLDRVFGKTTTKLDIENVTDKEEVTQQQLNDEFDKYKDKIIIE